MASGGKPDTACRVRIAFLILAHHMPRHLARLCRALRHPDHRFFVHIDRKSDISQFDQTADDTVFIADRVRVKWGDIGTVEATLRLLEAAGTGFDRLVLLSGADYPIFRAEAINRFFAEHTDIEFMNFVPMPSAAANKELDRLEMFVPRGFADRVKRKLLGSRNRNWQRALGAMQPYGGSTWWAITLPAAQILLQGATPALRRFYRNTHCPDEMLFQTLLCNSGHAPGQIRRSLHFTDWSEGLPHPALITQDHIEKLMKHPLAQEGDSYGSGTPLLFARKFVEDAAVLDLIDSIPLRPVPTPEWPRGDREPLFPSAHTHNNDERALVATG